MLAKKVTALLVSAALALSLLAGCGGSKALSQVIAGLLSGQYNNVTVEVDPDLTAALKKAAAAGSTQEEVLAALVENLNLSGVNLSFNNLGDGQQGQHGVTLTFQPGSDPDAAARSAFTEWNSVFSSLPDDGSYRAHVSMIEAEGGYYIAVDVEVLKAGSPHKDDGDDDKDNGDNGDDEDDAGYTTTEEDGTTTYTVTTGQGLQNLVEDLKWPSEDTILSVNITLNCDVTLDDPWIPIGADPNNKKAYTGTFDGQGRTIFGLSISSSAQHAGLFGCVGTGGKVQDLTLVSPTITGSSYAGAVAGRNDGGAIENCHVTGSGNISSSYIAGGVVGDNYSSVIGCSSSAKVTGTGSAPYTGGVVGRNNGGSVTACSSTGDVTANGSDTYTYAGGVVGTNENSGKVIACYATGNVTATGSDGRAGGVVGFNSSSGSVTACYHANGAVEGTGAGGVVGINVTANTVTACYWSGTVNGSTQSNQGIGIGSGDTKKVTCDGDTGEDENTVSCQTAVEAMNTALVEKNSDWRYTFTGSLPTLTKN